MHMDGMKEYINRHKFIRLASYLIDVLILVALSFVLFPMFKQAGPQDILAQISIVHGSVDTTVIQTETMTLMSLIESFTLSFAMMGCGYDILCFSVCKTTIGKALFGLQLECIDEDANRIVQIILRSVIKGLMIAFLGSILIVLSGFSVIASPEQLGIQDRIAKTKIQKRKA